MNSIIALLVALSVISSSMVNFVTSSQEATATTATTRKVLSNGAAAKTLGTGTVNPSPSPTPAPANLPIVITADQPNVWTLEQAHYLLAQMHRRNLDLKAASVGELDANDINGISVDALKTVLAVSAEFDQSVGVNNKLVKDEKQFRAARKRQLLDRQSSLEEQSLALTKEVAELKIKQVRTKEEEEKKELQGEIDELLIVQAVVKEQLTQTNDQLKSLSDTKIEFSSVNADAASATAASAYEGVFKDTAKKIIEQFNNSPKLNASLRLDNYLQMEYEILSKQLTLLRDEVGPGERLIFMEIPQSINSSYERANGKWAQSWWKIFGYSRCAFYDDVRKQFVSCKSIPKIESDSMRGGMSTGQVVSMVRDYKATPTAVNQLGLEDIETKWALESYFRAPRSPLGEALFHNLSESSKEVINAYDIKKPLQPGSAEWHKLRQDIVRVLNRFIKGEILLNFNPEETPGPTAWNIDRSVLSEGSSTFKRLYLEATFGWIRPMKQEQEVIKLDAPGNGNQGTKDTEDRSLRVVDLFPRQSSLNVNDLKLRANTFSAKFLFNFLAGWGGGANYQRDRERYSQFVQQELYASAFGKGGREFGWTFNPMPGTDRLLSGVRTTYAILIVPDDTSSILLESRGCFFPRTSSQPINFDDNNLNDRFKSRTDQGGCGASKKFVVPIPNGGSTSGPFEVHSIGYRNVGKSERAVIRIQGKGFSSQIGVLVNGIPLAQSLGLGQPFIRDDSTVGKATSSEISGAKVKGTFERIDDTLIVAAFEMDKDYQGTPTITLVAPGFSRELNFQQGLDVNGIFVPPVSLTRPGTDLTQYWQPVMFGPNYPVTIDKVAAFPAGNQLRLVLTGKNLDTVRSVFVNGLETKNPNTRNRALVFDPHLIAIPSLPNFSKDKTLHVSLLTDEDAVNATPIDNPAFEKAPEPPIKYVFDETKLTITAKPQFEGCVEKGETLTATFTVTGKGFTDSTKAFVINDKKEEELEFVPNTSIDGTLTVKNPKPQMKLIFKDSSLKVKAQRVLIWKKPKDGC